MKLRLLFIGTTMLSAALFPHTVAAESDSRFFGSYCGTHTEVIRATFRILGIPVRRETFRLEFSITAQVAHQVTPRRNGLINGSGEVVLENEDIPGWVERRLPAEARDLLRPGSRLPVVFSGAVQRRGAIAGSGSAPGWGTLRGSGFLSPDGNALTVSAAGRRITAHKDRCGNAAPSARILAPAADRFPWGEHIGFRATASDPEDASFPSERLVWTSDRDGHLGNGRELRASFLSTGRHRIHFTATDSGGRQAVAEKVIDIANNAPRVWIDSPGAGGRYYAGVPITFRGRGWDREAGRLSLAELSWTVGGRTLGTGDLLTEPLPEGSHRVTLSASDGSLTGSASVDLSVSTVPAGGAPPQITIISPENWLSLSDLPDDCLILAASVSDLEDSAAGLTVTWEDRAVDATAWRPLGTGQRIEECAFPAGAHDTVRIIRATVTDSSGASASDTVRILVIPGGLI